MEHKEWDDPELIDYWGSQTYPLGKWPTEPPTTEEAAESLVKVSPEAINQGYNFELSSKSVPDKSGWGDYELPIVRYDNDIRYGDVFFTGGMDEHYVVPEVPCTISILKEGSLGKAIVRTRKEDLRVLIPADNTRKALKTYVDILKDKKAIKVKKSKERLKKELLKFEKMEVRTNFKFGLVYCKEDENDEDNLFGASGGSPAYEEFLDFIGDRITLRGWDKYRGGLDVKNDDTGKESVYTTHKIYEVMFHVCTMLPVLGIDTQKVERKRHIGNDVVVLVFKEQSSKDDKFNPLIFTSHFIHCIFVVTPEVVESDKENTYYRLSVANKPGVPTYPPFLPENPVFKKGKEFQEFLIAKMINAERAAYASPEFASLYTSRKERLDLLCKEFAADDPGDN